MTGDPGALPPATGLGVVPRRPGVAVERRASTRPGRTPTMSLPCRRRDASRLHVRNALAHDVASPGHGRRPRRARDAGARVTLLGRRALRRRARPAMRWCRRRSSFRAPRRAGVDPRPARRRPGARTGGPAPHPPSRRGLRDRRRVRRRRRGRRRRRAAAARRRRDGRAHEATSTASRRRAGCEPSRTCAAGARAHDVRRRRGAVGRAASRRGRLRAQGRARRGAHPLRPESWRPAMPGSTRR